MPSLRPFALALSLIPVCLGAQGSSADTSKDEFHAGQWAVQFGPGLSLVNVGILKFTSPRSAWLLLFDVSAEYRNGTETINGTASDVDEHTVLFSAMIGRRFYQMPRHKVRSFESIGLGGSYVNQKQTIALSSTTYTAKDWSAGLFGELGGAYFVTHNLSLGATANASAGYTRRTTDSFNDNLKVDGWYVSGVDVRFIVGLYF